MSKQELLKKLEEKGLHVHVLPKEDAEVIYDSRRKSAPGIMPSYLDTHYVINNQGEVTYIGWLGGVASHASSYLSR